MKSSITYKIWQVIYPVGMYYVVSSMAYFLLGLVIGTAQETYMMRQMVCAAVTIPVVMNYYRQDKVIEDNVYGKEKIRFDGKLLKDVVVALLTGATLGMAVNNIIAMTPLMDMSAGFQEANESFFAGTFVFEFLGSCLLIPIAEEILYRGVVYKRLKLLFGVKYAIPLSALIFGAMHVNLIQFLYAGILGLFLAFLYEKTRRIYAPILGHIAANIAAVVRQETGWLEFSYEPTVAGISVTAALLVVAAVVIMMYLRSLDKDNAI